MSGGGKMEKPIEEKRYPAIDGLRSFGAFAIVLFHIVNKLLFTFLIPGGDKLEVFLSSFVSLFMMISAFSLCCGYYEKIKENKITLNDFYKKRYLRILPLFLIMVLSDILFSGISKNNLFEGFANVTLLFGFLPHKHVEILGVGWTIGVIFAFYLLFPFFVFATWNKKRAWLFLIVSLLLRYVSLNYFFDKDIEVVHSFIVWIPYFVLGIILYQYKDTLTKLLFKIRYLLWVVCIGLLTLKYINPSLLGRNIYDFYRILSDASLLMVAIVSSSLLLSNKVTKFLGNISFEIYIIHMIFVNIIFKILKLNEKITDLYVSAAVLFAIVIIFSIISSIIWKKVNEMIKKIRYNK